MKPWNIVRSVIDENDSQFITKHDNEGNKEVVHIKLLRNNTFVIVTGQKGNTKVGGLSASSGMVPELKWGPKLSRTLLKQLWSTLAGNPEKWG
ncbi:Probable ribosomal protein S11, mitochondrial [Linum grandiflorum]